MKRLATAAIVLGLCACQTDTEIDPTSEMEQAFTLASPCTAKFPQLSVWNGSAPPTRTYGVYVMQRSKYAGWWIMSLVDVSSSSIPWAVWVSDNSVGQMATHTAKYPSLTQPSLVGPGGNPPPPPCEDNWQCSVRTVFAARRVWTMPTDVGDDCASCGSTGGTTAP